VIGVGGYRLTSKIDEKVRIKNGHRQTNFCSGLANARKRSEI
jgi:hypothetical protein